MLIETKGKAVELLNKSLPYPEHMGNIDLDKENVLHFDWRSARYVLDMQFCDVMESKEGMLFGNDASILMTKLLKDHLGAIL